MAATAGKLTAIKAKSAPVGKHFDGGGLFLGVKRQDARYWRMKYRFAGKERLLAIGVFPQVSLAEASQRRDAARGILRDQRDPSAEKQAVQRRAVSDAAKDFRVIAAEWLGRQQGILAEVVRVKATWLLGLV